MDEVEENFIRITHIRLYLVKFDDSIKTENPKTLFIVFVSKD